MNKLKYSVSYLIGSIEGCPNYGVGWRQEITPFLRSLGVIVLDPTNKAIDLGPEIKDNVEYINTLKSQGKYETVQELMKTIRNVDLRQVDKSDFVICYLNFERKLCGSWEELFLANSQKKPTLVVCKQGVKEIPNWLFGAIPYDCFFDNFNQLKFYLRDVDRGLIDNKRWALFDLESQIKETCYGSFGPTHSS